MRGPEVSSASTVFANVGGAALFAIASPRRSPCAPGGSGRTVAAMMSVFAVALLAAGAAAAPAPRPNILFIMADDHAAHAISAYGSRVNETPNLDRLAREGVAFRKAFVTNSICTPSRASILTGSYSHKNGVPVFNRFDGAQPTVAKLLQAAGYHTGIVGKWHLGSDPTGFDSWEILPGQGVYQDPALYTATGETTYRGRYVTDVITDLAIDFIRNRPKDRPFFGSPAVSVG
jgi:arylsulfatase A-like enzyme